MNMTIDEKKSVLDGRLVDLQKMVESLIHSINCSNDEGINEAFDIVEDSLAKSRELYDEIYDDELEAMAIELEKKEEE